MWLSLKRRLDADGVSWDEERLRDSKKGCLNQVSLRDSWMSFEPWTHFGDLCDLTTSARYGSGTWASSTSSTLDSSEDIWKFLFHGFGHFYLLWFLIGQWSQSNRLFSTLRFQGFCKSFSLLTVLHLRSPIYWITMHIECSRAWILNIDRYGFAPETIIRTEDFE